MNEQQQELYEKLLKKVNEYCLGYAAEDLIEAIDDLVDTYEKYQKALEIIKEKILDMDYFNIIADRCDLTYQEYELLKEILK